MDLIFKCPNCDQELEVDARGRRIHSAMPVLFEHHHGAESAGRPTPSRPRRRAASRAGGETLQRAEPRNGRPTALIQKAKPPAGGGGQGRRQDDAIKTFKRSDCQEVGRDRFDEKVSAVPGARSGQVNIVSINTINYSAIDMATHNQAPGLRGDGGVQGIASRGSAGQPLNWTAMTEALWPPKPKELLTAAATFISRAAPGT